MTGDPYPAIFIRFADTQIGHLETVIRPRESEQLDYEAELALIIGKGGRHIKASEAMAHVAGYSCYNDVSVRDYQRHASQWTPGKNFPRTGPFGPFLVTPDEVGDLQGKKIATRLNRDTVQSSTLDMMIFPPPKLIEYISSFTPLYPGDVIATGTPGGVGWVRKPPLWMKPGDTVEIEIEGVGPAEKQHRRRRLTAPAAGLIRQAGSVKLCSLPRVRAVSGPKSSLAIFTPCNPPQRGQKGGSHG